MLHVIMFFESEDLGRRAEAAVAEAFAAVPGDGHLSDVEVCAGVREFEAQKGIGYSFAMRDGLECQFSTEFCNRVVSEALRTRQGFAEKLWAVVESLQDSPRFWVAFAFDWPAGAEINLLVGSHEDFDAYMRLNRGGFRLLHSVGWGAFNVDLDTPVVWEPSQSPVGRSC